MSKILVAYFSATGITDKLAHTLAKAIDADIYQIKPVIPYTDNDLDWKNPNSRSSVEMQNKLSRPEIIGDLASIDAYDVIFIAFPIWWYVAPTIINTFLESYNLEHKLIVPIATSGGSPFGDTNKAILPSCNGAKLASGRVFDANANTSEIYEWSKQFI